MKNILNLTGNSNSIPMLSGSVNKIRDILRSEGITGKDSVNHCICFVISRFLNKERCRALKFPEKFAYEALLEEKSEHELYEKFYRPGHPDCLMWYFVNTLGMKMIKTFGVKIPRNLWNILRALEPLDINSLSERYDIIGTIYELHLKTGSTGSGMRDLGQYFTNRKVIEFMVKLCDPKIINGQMETVLDPTMGTGGFLVNVLKYLQDRYGEIDWSQQQSFLFGFDIDRDITTLASLNLLLETGVWFPNLTQQDTLCDDMDIPKIKVLLANEPMGLKNISYESCCEQIRKLGIPGTKAEPLFLQLFMGSLDEGGRCAVVVPEGCLFIESVLHVKTRQMLVENFNLKKVISLQGNFFLNTGVKTSILYFIKEGRTSEVEFSEIKIDPEGNLIEEIILKAKYKDIVAKRYNLLVNIYREVTQPKLRGTEWAKLKDICRFLPKSRRLAGFGKDVGKFPFFSSSMKSKRCDIADYAEECIIIGTGGNPNVKFARNFSCSADNIILQSKSAHVLSKYIYYYLLDNTQILENGFHGSTIKHLSKGYIENIEIPIPPLEIQQSIIERLNLLPGNNEKIQELIRENDTFVRRVLQDFLQKDYCENDNYFRRLSEVISILEHLSLEKLVPQIPCPICGKSLINEDVSNAICDDCKSLIVLPSGPEPNFILEVIGTVQNK